MQKLKSPKMVIFLKITFKNKLISYLIYYILKN
jgi:hypothetical protein